MNNLLISGGWFIWPLLVCSILLISIVLERLWFLQRRLVAPKGLLRQIQNLIKKDSFHSHNQQDISITSHLGDLLQHCYQYKSYPREFVEVKAEEKASEIKILLERNLSMLSTIASISPLLGLLGTVVGMIKVFSNIDIKEKPQKKDKSTRLITKESKWMYDNITYDDEIKILNDL